MENKNQTIIIGLLALIFGLFFGYFFGTSTMSHRGFFSDNSMYEEMGEHMFENEITDSDGELQHMMSEMMLIGRGQTGKAYEEAWLRGMIVHHMGAIEMSKELLKQTDRSELVEIANNIIKSQSTEVDKMQGWLKQWFNEN